MLKKVNLPGTDLQVSELCYGTNMLGTAIDQPSANAILDRFVELGGNFLDTARSYGDWVPDAPAGASERAIGAWLKGRNRDDVVIATKGAQVDMRAGDWRNRVTPEDIASDLAESLDHLGVDTIDLYWLHADNPQAPVGPIMDALFAHQDAGKIRYIGASNWSPERIREANAYAASKGRQGFVASQTFWGLAAPEREASAAQGYQLYYEDGYQDIHAEGVTMIPYSAQSGGYFTKLAHGEAAVPDMLKARYNNPINAKRFEAVKAVAERHDASINDVVLGYLTNQPNTTVPIFGARSPEQIEDSVKAADLALSADELTKLRGE
ncbi:putative oxidoreductase [Caenibius tardaugens NBRC 16725]|uniref:Putative oxidoreductase n=1 Tax=Caenibius tardaugens NBRC 16725 TaxID=1219035 RepID=U3A119_9SPHN|nr:aldo/keto reductase [Caenibius tardaugens]AZI34917.1 aldo/keto reductase [Caenibius tardaugens NBRC 16725]GAD48458.1 putative oxidoreductase [Caenibius tardaugens NBRC 16725]